MEIIKELFTSKLFWGFLIGMALCLFSMYAHFKTKIELRRLKSHLTDKLELEADKLSSMKEEIGGLKEENENLRLKINSSRTGSDKQELERELEIFARAEKAMMVNAPGFAPAWEKAKEGAAEEIVAEERGKSLPKRIFRKFFNKTDVLGGEVVEALPEKSTTSDSANSSSGEPQNATS